MCALAHTRGECGASAAVLRLAERVQSRPVRSNWTWCRLRRAGPLRAGTVTANLAAAWRLRYRSTPAHQGEFILRYLNHPPDPRGSTAISKHENINAFEGAVFYGNGAAARACGPRSPAHTGRGARPLLRGDHDLEQPHGLTTSIDGSAQRPVSCPHRTAPVTSTAKRSSSRCAISPTGSVATRAAASSSASGAPQIMRTISTISKLWPSVVRMPFGCRTAAAGFGEDRSTSR